MFFRKILGVILGLCFLLSCKSKCSKKVEFITGVWTDNIAKYYFYDDFRYEYKFLRSGNVLDTVSIADSAYGTYKIDNCQKVISLAQEGYYPIAMDSIFVPKNINFGTWHYKQQGDTLLEIETATTYMKLKKL